MGIHTYGVLVSVGIHRFNFVFILLSENDARCFRTWCASVFILHICRCKKVVFYFYILADIYPFYPRQLNSDNQQPFIFTRV